MIVRAAGLALLLLVPGIAVTRPAAAPPEPVQLLPLPSIAAAPLPAPLPPPINPSVAAPPKNGISPLLLGAPALAAPTPSSAYPPLALPGPIDQQKVTSYRLWLEGRLRLLERGGGPDELLGRELRQQLLQLDESGAP